MKSAYQLARQSDNLIGWSQSRGPSRLMNPKLTFSIPIFPGLGLRVHEIELPASRIASALRRTSHLTDPTSWAAAIRLTLQFIFDDMHVAGNLRGGWGKSYAERYLSDMYPHGVPSDASQQPDSPSGTAMVVDGLANLLHIDGLLTPEARHEINECLNETSIYFANRHHPVTGAVGVMTRLAGGDTAVAYNIRHTAMALRALRFLPNQYERIGQTCRNIVESADTLNLEAERALTVAAVASSLLWINSQPDLCRGLPGAHHIPYLIKKAEIALLSQWSDVCRGWYDGKHAEVTAQWYSAFVLTELSGESLRIGEELRTRLKTARTALISTAQSVGDGMGIPYFRGGSPDLGMTCVLFNIMTKGGRDRNEDRLLRALGRFIVACGATVDNDRHLRDAYPWTLAALFSGLNTLLTKGSSN